MTPRVMHETELQIRVCGHGLLLGEGNSTRRVTHFGCLFQVGTVNDPTSEEPRPKFGASLLSLQKVYFSKESLNKPFKLGGSIHECE